jgi:hypothetical protein
MPGMARSNRATVMSLPFAQPLHRLVERTDLDHLGHAEAVQQDRADRHAEELVIVGDQCHVADICHLCSAPTK